MTTATHSLPAKMMMKFLVLPLLLAAAVFADPYPRYEQVVRDPTTNDLLYGTNSGPHKETWYFNTITTLTSIIIPSQIINFCRSGPSTNGTYEEAVNLSLYETKMNPSKVVEYEHLIGSGSFNGSINYGQEMEIPLWNATLGRAPLVQTDTWYIRNKITYYTAFYKYTLNIDFKTAGIYPWYNTRVLSSYSVVSASTNVAGIAIGLTYTF